MSSADYRHFFFPPQLPFPTLTSPPFRQARLFSTVVHCFFFTMLLRVLPPRQSNPFFTVAPLSCRPPAYPFHEFPPSKARTLTVIVVARISFSMKRKVAAFLNFVCLVCVTHTVSATCEALQLTQ